MELLLAILMCLFFIALIAIGEIYLNLDKYKTRATVCIKKMTPTLDEWVKCSVELAESSNTDQKSAAALRALAQNYFSCKKYRELPNKIPLVNSIFALSARHQADTSGTAASGTLRARLDAAANLSMLVTGYNESVKKLNNRLDKKLTGAIGKLFRVGKLEILRDLSKA